MKKSKSKSPGKISISSVVTGHTFHNKSVESYSKPTLGSEIPPSSLHPQQPEILPPYQTPRWKSFLEVAALAVAIIVAIIYFCQLRLTERSLDVDQRAWVGPKSFVILNPPIEANKPIQVGIEYGNFGKTPALKVSGFAQPNFVTSEAKLDFTKWGHPIEAQRATLFPGASNHLVRTIPDDLPNFPANHPDPGIPEPVFSELKQGKSFIYIYGNIEYDDIFSLRHWTHFCLRYSFPQSGFVYCETFNDVDTEER